MIRREDFRPVTGHARYAADLPVAAAERVDLPASPDNLRGRATSIRETVQR